MTKILIDRSVLEQALEALFMYKPMVTGVTFQHGLDAMQALRAALEQPQVEQEPVAWCHLHYYEDGSYFADCLQHYQDNYCKTPLYLHPQPPRQPLTEDEINTIWRNSTHMTIVEVVRAIEAAHGIKEQK